MVGDERIQAGVVLWAAGVAASPAAKWLSAESDRAGRVKVGADLTLGMLRVGRRVWRDPRRSAVAG
jgi:NADH dehydrogenase FAD-containing subunit